MLVVRLVVLVSCAICAAIPAGGQRAPVFRTDWWSTEDGLPSVSLTGMAQTVDGYLWLAAGGNLVRFDGFEFKVHNTATNPVIRGRVNRLYAGAGDTLWIGLDDGTVLSLWRGQFSELGRLPHRSNTAFVQDRTGALLVVGRNQVLRWDGSGFAEVPVPNGWRPARGQPHARRDASGDAWLIGIDGELLRIRQGTVERAGTTQAPNIVMYPSRREILSVRRRARIGEVLNAKGGVIATFLWEARIRPLLIDRRGRLWASAAREVLVYSREGHEPVVRIQLGNDVNPGSMLEDHAGNIWISGDGLTRIQEVPFRTVVRTPGLSGIGRQVRALTRGPRGTVLAEVALGEPGVYQFAGDTVVRYASGFANAWTDTRGTVWLAQRQGLLVGRRDGQPDLIVPRSPRAQFLIADDPSRAGTIWFAGAGVLYHAEPYAAGAPRIVDSLVVEGSPRLLAVDSQGTVWAVTVDAERAQHLIRYRRGDVARWSRRDGLPAATARAIHVDSDGSIWLGLYGGGLVRFADNEFRSIGPEHGLAENVVSCILDDGAGNFWMAGNRGVHRVRREEAVAFLERRVPRVHGVAYGRRDGLTDPETTGDPCVRGGDGRLWFPTFAGAAVVDPVLAVALDSTPPRAHVHGIRTTGDTLLPSRITRLSLGQRRLAFSYTGVSLRNPAGVRFQYRLDGVDDDWIYNGAGRVATYNDVGPGNHTFRVRAVNAGGAWSTDDATFAFTVPAYFHETIPFYVLLTGLIVFGAHLLWRARTVQLRHRQAELSAMVNARTGELGRALALVENQASRLRTLDEAKSRFFANVSHEFRTPLTLILGPVEDVRDGRAGPVPEAARLRLGTALTNGRRLTQLVEQLLDVARLESGTMTLRAEVRDIVPLLRRMAESYASLAERKGIAFQVSCPAGGLRVRHDPDQLEKVIGNLLGNALKFTPSGGRVELRAQLGTGAPDGWAVVEVEDTGPGIPEKHQPHVFERFYQVDDSSRRAHEGTGIGLALARELVDLHGGILSLRSVEGAGSTFTVRLPLASGDATAASETTVASKPDEPRQMAQAPSSSAAPDDAALSRASTGDDVTTVLVVEDNADLLAYLKEHLADQYRVLEADNGARALELAREHVPDLIVSDVMMPELDGQGLCEAIKSDPETDFIPVILLTAKASRESRLAGLEGGADEYLAKPVDMRELLVRAANIIASRRRLRERWGADSRDLPTLQAPHLPAPRDAGSEGFLRKLYAAMAERIGDEDFQVDALAAAVAMSRSTLYRRLEALTGRSPMDMLWNYRLEQAAQWLTETDANVSEIAYGVGFKSVPHFCARFRERFGRSPSAFRKRAEMQLARSQTR